MFNIDQRYCEFDDAQKKFTVWASEVGIDPDYAPDEIFIGDDDDDGRGFLFLKYRVGKDLFGKVASIVYLTKPGRGYDLFSLTILVGPPTATICAQCNAVVDDPVRHECAP